MREDRQRQTDRCFEQIACGKREIDAVEPLRGVEKDLQMDRCQLKDPTGGDATERSGHGGQWDRAMNPVRIGDDSREDEQGAGGGEHAHIVTQSQDDGRNTGQVSMQNRLVQERGGRLRQTQFQQRYVEEHLVAEGVETGVSTAPVLVDKAQLHNRGDEARRKKRARAESAFGTYRL